MEFLPKKLDDYVGSHTSEESGLLKELDRETNLKVLQPRMLSGHVQGRILSMLSHMIKPDNILEIGTYTGYSALCLAEGLSEGGKLYTIDINEELESMVRKYFDKSGYTDNIEYLIGNAIDIIPKLTAKYDLVFIDADKINYSNYFDLVIDKLVPGGFLIADNVLWSGKVVEQVKQGDKDTKALIDFNDKIQRDPRVENALFPVRDGLMIMRKV